MMPWPWLKTQLPQQQVEPLLIFLEELGKIQELPG